MIERTGWHGPDHSPVEAESGELSGRKRMDTSSPSMDWIVEAAEPKHGIVSRPRRPRRARWIRSTGLLPLVLLTALLLVDCANAAFIDYNNCLDPNIVNSNNPQQLQFVPLFVWATFNSSSSHNINVTVYGNVTGIATQQPYPAVDDPQWKNPNDSVGKIPDIAGPTDDQKYTTFTTEFNVLDYTPYNPDATRFCNSSALIDCPLTPVFTNLTINE